MFRFTEDKICPKPAINTFDRDLFNFTSYSDSDTSCYTAAFRKLFNVSAFLHLHSINTAPLAIVFTFSTSIDG